MLLSNNSFIIDVPFTNSFKKKLVPFISSCNSYSAFDTFSVTVNFSFDGLFKSLKKLVINFLFEKATLGNPTTSTIDVIVESLFISSISSRVISFPRSAYLTPFE